jgi:hypothetical protein
MATTTPNFGWPVPTSTDLVKDGATAIEALGDSIDASLLDLKGGTSGQVLAKNSNTDMDFVWVTDAAGDITGVTAGTGISGGGTSGTVTVTNSMATAIDAKGDLIAGTGADAFSRLAVGTNGQVLVADSAEATGIKWAAPASSGMTLITTQALSATATLNINDCFSTTYRNYLIVMEVTGTAAEAIACRLRVAGSDATTNYNIQYLEAKNTAISGARVTSANKWDMQATRTSGKAVFTMTLNSPFEATSTSYISPGIDPDGTISLSIWAGVNTNATSYTGITFFQTTSTMTGNVSIYGLAK